MKKCFLALVMALVLACAAGLAQEGYPECQFDLESYGGTLKMIYTDGTVDETGGWGIGTEITEERRTVGDAIAMLDVAALEVSHEEDSFEGWLMFEVSTTVDEYGWDENEYVLLSSEPLSTEELMAQPLSEKRIMYAAKWAGIPAEEYFHSEAEEAYIVMPSATLFANGGEMLMDGEDEDYTSTLNVATVEEGQLLGEALELDKLLSVTWEGYAFDGWKVYEVGSMETREGQPEEAQQPCFEGFDGWYTVLHDVSVLHESISTEELSDMVFGGTDLFIMANWK